MKDKLTLPLMAICIVAFIITAISQAAKVKDNGYIEVYTNTDIYYLYHDSLTSETGRTYIVGRYSDLKDSLSFITARETEK